MPRFFVSPAQIKDKSVIVTGPDVLHITRVLRLRAGDLITILDGRGGIYEAVIERATGQEVYCAIKSKLVSDDAPALRVTVVQGLPKGDKMDLIIQKGTELGVSRIVTLRCERSVINLGGIRSARRVARWRRIAQEAAKQSCRLDIPEVLEPAGWPEVLDSLPAGSMALMLWEEEQVVTLQTVLREEPAPGEVYVFIGPEGGFTPDEVERARLRGIRTVSLGRRILRTETAGMAALAMILYQWGDLGG
ncbi:MAG: 16S rRNA (uracil(1498)-N(3))-methyltransferase [Peptococcaceae bacterium]|nr:MAG: 16S rRNA (uracil(1498)-N(3))-methyltransferase [Peptococcaceae bacterium]